MSAEDWPVLATRIPGAPAGGRPDRLVLVDDPEAGYVAVRWYLDQSPKWRCKACGPQEVVECIHTFAAAVRLSADLLGLRPAQPSPEARATPLRTPDTSTERSRTQ